MKLINSICGIRGVHLIGTKSPDNITNLAIFSSVVHLGSNPSLLGFVSRPSEKVKRDTIANIMSTNYYTINSIHEGILDKAHKTSGKYLSSISPSLEVLILLIKKFLSNKNSNGVLLIG